MLEELKTEWIEYISEAKDGFGFHTKIRTTKRLLYRSEPCNNASIGSSGNKGEGVVDDETCMSKLRNIANKAYKIGEHEILSDALQAAKYLRMEHESKEAAE